MYQVLLYNIYNSNTKKESKLDVIEMKLRTPEYEFVLLMLFDWGGIIWNNKTLFVLLIILSVYK